MIKELWSHLSVRLLTVLITVVGLLSAGRAMAADLQIEWRYTGFMDTSILERVDFSCGYNVTGPFDSFVYEDLGPYESVEHNFTISDSPKNDLYCVAFAVDRDGRISEASNVAYYNYKEPPAGIKLLELEDVWHGQVNFNFTIETTTE